MNALQAFLLLLVHVSFAKGSENLIIDLEDIMSPRYMPSNVFSLDKATQNPSNYTLNQTDIHPDGSMREALGTMKFHRAMMNQYLCRSYVADKIVSGFVQEKIQKRRGGTSLDPLEGKKNIRDQLLYDEGSSIYDSWLSRSSTLEDIYRNHGSNDMHKDSVPQFETIENNGEKKGSIHDFDYNKISTRDPAANMYTDPEGDYHSNHRDIALDSTGSHIIEHEPVVFHYPQRYPVHYKDEGYDKSQELANIFEIALTAVAFLSFGMFIVHLIMSISALNNYATTTPNEFMPMSMNPTATAPDGDSNTDFTATDNDSSSTGEGSSSTGDGSSSTGDGSSSTGDGSSSTGDGSSSTGDGSSSTGDGSSTTGDGTFQTGTGVTSTGSGSSTGGDTGDMSNPPFTGTGTDSLSTVDVDGQNDRFQFRLKRGISAITNSDQVAINEMTKRILSSIDASLISYTDNGHCLEKSICISNRYSTRLQGLNKFILPMWNLGMIWIQRSISENTGSVTKGLKAAVLGLANGHCELIYQHCNIKSLKAALKTK